MNIEKKCIVKIDPYKTNDIKAIFEPIYILEEGTIIPLDYSSREHEFPNTGTIYRDLQNTELQKIIFDYHYFICIHEELRNAEKYKEDRSMALRYAKKIVPLLPIIRIPFENTNINRFEYLRENIEQISIDIVKKFNGNPCQYVYVYVGDDSYIELNNVDLKYSIAHELNDKVTVFAQKIDNKSIIRINEIEYIEKNTSKKTNKKFVCGDDDSFIRFILKRISKDKSTAYSLTQKEISNIISITRVQLQSATPAV